MTTTTTTPATITTLGEDYIEATTADGTIIKLRYWAVPSCYTVGHAVNVVREYAPGSNASMNAYVPKVGSREERAAHVAALWDYYTEQVGTPNEARALRTFNEANDDLKDEIAAHKAGSF